MKNCLFFSGRYIILFTFYDFLAVYDSSGIWNVAPSSEEYSNFVILCVSIQTCVTRIKLEQKKPHTLKNCSLVKDPNFLSYLHVA